MSEVSRLTIYLGDLPVGELSLHRDEVSEFVFLDSYRALAHRPILGQAFEDDLKKPHRARMALPPFFANLLPEGALRELLARRLQVSPSREFLLLARLGQDLPGAVRAIPSGPMVEESEDRQAPSPSQPSPLKFSLAGVQLKLSMVREGRALTLPMRGQDGDWIVKLPDARHRGVPENEFATMKWAARVGLDVAPVELVNVQDLKGLPEGMALESGTHALAIPRFDRPRPGARVHIEDFAQVLGKYSAEKYGSTNYETLGRIILRTAGEAAFDEFIRRLTFIVVSGNGDAHIKNWSLIYRDGTTAALSPAYDLVSTLEFIHPDALALNLDRNKAWARLSMERFDSFARRVQVPESRVRDLVRQTIERARDAWVALQRDISVSQTMASRLAEHWRSVPLLSAE